MGKIKRLAKSVISKIAAGEIIERPCYVVKELIENALDAKATQIDIEIKDSGLTEIIVTDNGHGMKKDDLILSIEPHTTSKIRSIEDLSNINTLGFRGEALSSISAVAQVIIESKAKSETLGYRLIKVNQNLDISPIGMKNGTKVTIQRLFENIPIRKKFLKSKRTEFKHIVDIVSDYVISRENIGINLFHDGKVIINTYPSQTLDEKIPALFGQIFSENLIPFNEELPYLKICGFVGHPQISLSSSSKLFLFVNGRRVSNALLLSAIKDAYTNLLEPAMFPIGILFFDVPSEVVDVNIHPRKEDIKFSIPEQVYELTTKSVLKTLQDKNLTFGNISWKKSEVGSYAGELLKEELFDDYIENSNEIAQIKKTYLIKETQKGVAFFDQHAVHEAILFRKLKQKFLDKLSEHENVLLESPFFLNLSKGETEILWDYKEILSNVGYTIEDFGDGTPILTSVPKLLQDRNHIEIIQEIIESLSQSKTLKKIDHKSNKMLSYIACRSAIKAGQILTKEQRSDLINQLEEEDFVYTCPHGRPVKIEITINQLHKQFKRK